MVQRTVLKVDVACQRCKKKLLRAVSGLEGVDKVEVDAAKGTLTVTGKADPYQVAVRARKATGRYAEVESVGPPPDPKAKQGDGDSKDGSEKAKPKSDDHQQKCQQPLYLPSTSCTRCDRLYIHIIDDPNVSCSIL
ncbi:heavy metal-associated isoprenylated plant protein 12-like [Macadamia integrifolia]|uniref:heavy metal-associated isoprenylated plant protein 12-like n=1 Tax=Macadamia integrifolia TaxID=60698 RepID=UPI001C4FB820|nr:heavy metal-associated isoprenylated plant protein 12-like [Macadamia integrifolia]